MQLSGAQKAAKFFSSAKKFIAMKDESMQWIFICNKCDESSSIWDAGGIRYKATGQPKVSVRCPKCNTVGIYKITKQETS